MIFDPDEFVFVPCMFSFSNFFAVNFLEMVFSFGNRDVKEFVLKRGVLFFP